MRSCRSPCRSPSRSSTSTNCCSSPSSSSSSLSSPATATSTATTLSSCSLRTTSPTSTQQHQQQPQRRRSRSSSALSSLWCSSSSSSNSKSDSKSFGGCSSSSSSSAWRTASFGLLFLILSLSMRVAGQFISLLFLLNFIEFSSMTVKRAKNILSQAVNAAPCLLSYVYTHELLIDIFACLDKLPSTTVHLPTKWEEGVVNRKARGSFF